MKCSPKFKEIHVAPDKHLKYGINIKKRVTDLLRKFKNKNAISERAYKKLKVFDSKPGTLHGSSIL